MDHKLLQSFANKTSRRIIIICILLLLVLLAAGSFLRKSPRQPQKKTTAIPWSATLLDYDRSILSNNPLPMQFETVRNASFVKIYRGNPQKKQIALTFDDGPKAEYTEKLLLILKEEGAKATFFDVGKSIAKHPELLIAQLNDGHCVGTHTYNHDRLTKVSHAEMLHDIRQGAEEIKKVTGQSPRYFRPPGGTFDRSVLNVIDNMGYKTVLWSINTGDYQQPGVNIISNKVLNNVSNGAIILFHEGVPQTIEALPNIIRTLRKRGYSLVTIDELQGVKNQYSLPLPMPKNIPDNTVTNLTEPDLPTTQP